MSDTPTTAAPRDTMPSRTIAELIEHTLDIYAHSIAQRVAFELRRVVARNASTTAPAPTHSARLESVVQQWYVNTSDVVTLAESDIETLCARLRAAFPHIDAPHSAVSATLAPRGATGRDLHEGVSFSSPAYQKRQRHAELWFNIEQLVRSACPVAHEDAAYRSPALIADDILEAVERAALPADGGAPVVGTDGHLWPQTADAHAWAVMFCRRHQFTEEGDVVGWFANAIEYAALDARTRALEKHAANLSVEDHIKAINTLVETTVARVDADGSAYMDGSEALTMNNATRFKQPITTVLVFRDRRVL